MTPSELRRFAVLFVANVGLLAVMVGINVHRSVAVTATGFAVLVVMMSIYVFLRHKDRKKEQQKEEQERR